MSTVYQFEIWQGDECVAAGEAGDLEAMRREAFHYALQYSQDGPVDVKEYVRYSLAPAETAAGVPIGWKLVPVEPTTEMLVAAENAGVPDGEGLYYPFRVDEVGVAYCAMLASSPKPPAAPKGAWVSVEERLPELGEEVLVWSCQPWEKEHSMKLDTWDEQREAPLSFSSQTILIGPGWNDHDDFDSVVAWMTKPPPPGTPKESEHG